MSRTLAALFFPGITFLFGLLLLDLFVWQAAVVAASGTIATFAGLLDWRYHRSGAVQIGVPEHRAHFVALAGGGGSLFVLMAIASSIERPQVMLLPVIVALIFTVVAICYDELVFHRRRKLTRYETALHRTLIFGNAVAFLAWAHWCFVEVAVA